MHFLALPIPLLLLLLSSSTFAAPIGQSCRTISFLSPRHQSVFGIRQDCKYEASLMPDRVYESTLGDEEPLLSKREYIWGPPNEIIPIEEFRAQAEKLRHINADLKLDLYTLRDPLTRSHPKVTISRPQEHLGIQSVLQPFAKLGRFLQVHVEGLGRGLAAILTNLDEHLVIGCVVAFVCACWILAGIEIFITERKQTKLRDKQQRHMRRVSRRGTKIRVTSRPFVLATIDEGEQSRFSNSMSPGDWDEKSDVVVAMTPCC